MNEEKKSTKTTFSMHVGSSSILLIFIILALISFACLTLSSTLSDRKLNAQVFDRTQAYYTAYSEAEKTLDTIDTTLHNIYTQTSNSDEYFKQAGTTKTFAIPISDVQILEVTLEILYPQSKSDYFYNVTSWSVLVVDDLTLDESLPVFGQ